MRDAMRDVDWIADIDEASRRGQRRYPLRVRGDDPLSMMQPASHKDMTTTLDYIRAP